jgi:hypothetical protein
LLPSDFDDRAPAITAKQNPANSSEISEHFVPHLFIYPSLSWQKNGTFQIIVQTAQQKRAAFFLFLLFVPRSNCGGAPEPTGSRVPSGRKCISAGDSARKRVHSSFDECFPYRMYVCPEPVLVK